MKYILILLGINNKYLGYKNFQSKIELDAFVEVELENLMLANIEKDLSLRDRLNLLKEYIPFAGSIVDFRIINVEN